MLSYRVTSLILGLMIAGVILILIRKRRLYIVYSLWWLFIALSSIVFGAFPGLIDKVSAGLGIHYPPILLVVGGMGLMLIKMLTMDIERSEQERKIRILAEQLAILKGGTPPGKCPVDE